MSTEDKRLIEGKPALHSVDGTGFSKHCSVVSYKWRRIRSFYAHICSCEGSRKHDPSTEVFHTNANSPCSMWMISRHTTWLEIQIQRHIVLKVEWLIEEQLMMMLGFNKIIRFRWCVPIGGMLNAIQRTSSMRKVWMRRGMFKKVTIPASVGSLTQLFLTMQFKKGDTMSQRWWPSYPFG